MSAHRFPAFSHLIFRMHALRQMFQRRISGDDIRYLLEHGMIIEDYPDDNPYPSCLISGLVGGRQLHCVVAYNNVDREAIVITAYEPDPEIWSDSFSRRRP